MKEEMVLMPKELTVENGAKGLLLGEFWQDVQVQCCECDGDPQDDCELCEGSGEYTKTIMISWTNIKEIYSAAVKGLSKCQCCAREHS